jgi:uncharacterized protein YqjF (DUF2071 family)
MRWEDLLFLHWPVAARVLQAHLPAGVEVETFDGQAWLGVVPFRMARTRWRWLPPVPTTHAFPELNVRTYVRAGGKSGVWFFSLDAASRVVVEVARRTFSLPYLHARTRSERRGGRVHHVSERRDRRAPEARFVGSWCAERAAVTAASGSLEHFLVERYCMFAQRSGRLFCGEIAHAPWRVARAEVELEVCDMTRLLGIDLSGAPVSALVAEPLDVAGFGMRALTC